MEASRRTEILSHYLTHARRFDEIARRRGTSGAPLAPARVGRRGAPSRRVLEVLSLMADGLDNREIARAMCVSEETVKSHAKKLFIALGAANRAHAVAIGFRSGLLPLDPPDAADLPQQLRSIASA